MRHYMLSQPHAENPSGRINVPTNEPIRSEDELRSLLQQAQADDPDADIRGYILDIDVTELRGEQ